MGAVGHPRTARPPHDAADRPGAPRTIPIGAVDVTDARFLGDGQHLVLVGSEPGHGRRLYHADLAGNLRPMSPDDITVWSNMLPVARDGRTAVRGPDGAVRVYSVAGAATPVPGIAADGMSIAWTDDDRARLVVTRERPTISRVDPASGARSPGPVLHPPVAGDAAHWTSMVFSRDGRTYAVNYGRETRRLFVVDRLR